MANGNSDSISGSMVLAQVARVQELVKNGDYSSCHVKGKQVVDLFLVDGIAAILKQTRGSSAKSFLSGGTGAAKQ